MRHASAIVVSLLLATALHGETASLKMRFVFDGDQPGLQQINLPAGLLPAGAAIPNERLLVDPKSKGIRNVVVYVYTGRGGSTLELDPYEGVKRQLIAVNGRFEPHVLLARSGDTLELINRDPIGHIPNIAFFNNPARGLVVPPGNPNVILLARSEPVPIPVVCNIHPWMKAYLVILDHSFAATSDKSGAIRIDGLPANADLVFRVHHEAGRIDQVKINGAPAAWNRSRFKINLSPGVNDLGDVLVVGDALWN